MAVSKFSTSRAANPVRYNTLLAGNGATYPHFVGYYTPFNGSTTAVGTSIALDSSNNVYSCSSSTLLNSATFVRQDGKSAKINLQRKLVQSNGQALANWARAVEVDSSGNIYVAGGGSSGFTPFLAKYNSSGTLQWQRTLTGSGAPPQGAIYNNICIDSSSNVYVAGTHSSSSGYTVAFLVKYNSSGTLQWQRQLSKATTNAGIYGATIDASANIFVAGSLGNNGFLAKYNTSGTIQWQQELSSTTAFESVALDSSGNIYTAGGAVISSKYNVLIAKFNSTGAVQWSKTLKSTAGTGFNDYANDIKIDSSGNIYVCGYFVDGVSTFFTRGFIAKYNSSGTLQFIRSLYDGNTSAGITMMDKMRLDSSNNLYMIGRLKITSGSITYPFVVKIPNDGSKTGAYQVTSTGTVNYSTSYDLTETAGAYTTSSGTATDAAGSLTDAAGTYTSVEDGQMVGYSVGIA